MGILEPLMVALVSLAGSSWVSHENAKQSVEFSTSLISGNAGCNEFSGTYVQTKSGVKIGHLSTTRMACKPEIMENEHKFLVALANTAKVETSRSTLILKDANGMVLFALNRKNVG